MLNNDGNKPCGPASNRRCHTSRVGSVKWATGHEDVDSWAPHAKLATRKKKHRLASWNVRGLNQSGKIEILQNELLRCNVDVAGISETHWKGSGHFQESQYTVYFSGSEDKKIHGVAVFVSNRINNCVLGYEPISDRVMSLKINANPCTINIVSVYAPTCDSSDDDVEEFYNSLETLLKRIPNKEITLLMGDFNAKIGNTENDNHIRNIVGKYGIGNRNDRGSRLIQFAIENNMAISNSMFEVHKRRLWTWRSPDGHTKNQIDYILVNQRWKTTIRHAKTLPSADCGSDHQMLICEIRGKLKVCERKQIYRYPKVVKSQGKMFNQVTMNNLAPHYQEIQNMNSEDTWQILKASVITSLKKLASTDQLTPIEHNRQPWLSDESKILIGKRREVKAQDLNRTEQRNMYRSLSRQIQASCRRDKK